MTPSVARPPVCGMSFPLRLRLVDSLTEFVRSGQERGPDLKGKREKRGVPHGPVGVMEELL